MTFKYDDRARQYARQAYQAFEPLHLVAYFSPPVVEVSKEMGLGRGSYFGWRAAPLGDCTGDVVAATFFNFSPETAKAGWAESRAKYSAEELLAGRERVADLALASAFGDLVESPDLTKLTDRLYELFADAPTAGRPLGAANLNLRRPEKPHVALWQAFTTLREWRGDGHIAALVLHGLGPVEALAFHEAKHPDPTVKSSRMGKPGVQKTRGYTDEDWRAAAESLQSRGVLEFDGDGNEVISAAGVELYQTIEDQTDDAAASVWAGVEDADEIFAAARPFVKAVINAGFLPGTTKK